MLEAAYLWFMDISATLKELGWTQGIYSMLAFRRASPEGMTCLGLHVDDGMMGRRRTQMYYDELATKYEMKKLGHTDTFLDMEVLHLLDDQDMFHRSRAPYRYIGCTRNQATAFAQTQGSAQSPISIYGR
jgi:hypothetical protein